MEERRRYPRVDALIRYRQARGPLKRASEISLGGVGVLTSEPLALGERLELDLYFPDSTGVTVQAEVAWMQEKSERQYQAGLAFCAASQEALDKIAQFVESGLEPSLRA